MLIVLNQLRASKYILLFLLLFLPSWLIAEVVVLRSGNVLKGEILLQNEEVLILRAESGMRYQYPISEVASIRLEEEEVIVEESQDVKTKHKVVSMRVQAMGGAVNVPHLGWGGQLGADLMVGANLWNDKLYIGGGVGYSAKIVDKTVYSFIPLKLSASSLLCDADNAPFIGMNIGYAFATDSHTEGGLCAGAELGWRFKINNESSFFLGVNADWQQAKTNVVETITNPHTNEVEDYINYMGVNFISFGAKIAIQF